MWFSKLFGKKEDLEIISAGQLDTSLNYKFKQLDVYNEFQKLERDLESKKVVIYKFLDEISVDKATALVKNFFDNITIKKDYREALRNLKVLSEQVMTLEAELKPIYFTHKKNKPSFTKLMKKIRETDSLVADKIYLLEQSDLSTFLEAKKYQVKYFETQDRITKMKKELDTAFRKRTELLEKKTKYATRKNDLKQKNRFQDLDELKKEKKNLEKQTSKLKAKLETLVKYLHIPKKAKEEFTKLNQDAMKTLKKHESDISSERFNKIKNAYNEYETKQEKINSISRRVRGNSVLLEVKEQEGWIERVSNEIKEFDKDILRMQNKLEDENPAFYLQELNKIIKEYNLRVVENAIN